MWCEDDFDEAFWQCCFVFKQTNNDRITATLHKCVFENCIEARTAACDADSCVDRDEVSRMDAK